MIKFLVAIGITVWIQGLFSGFVTLADTESGGTDIATLVRRALAEVCTVQVLLVVSEKGDKCVSLGNIATSLTMTLLCILLSSTTVKEF